MHKNHPSFLCNVTKHFLVYKNVTIGAQKRIDKGSQREYTEIVKAKCPCSPQKGHAWAIFVLSIVKLRFTIGICAAGFARADRRLSKSKILTSPLGARTRVCSYGRCFFGGKATEKTDLILFWFFTIEKILYCKGGRSL